MAITASELEVILRARNEASKSIDEVTKSVGGLAGILPSLGTAALAVGVGGMVVAAAGAGAFVGAVIDVTGKAIAAQPTLVALEAAISKTGAASGVTVEQAIALADQLQGITTYANGATIAAETVLASYSSIGKDVFPAVTAAVLDLATKMGTDAPHAAELLARAMTGDSAALKTLQRDIGPFTDAQLAMIKNFQDTGDKAGAQNAVLDAVNAKIGGLAEAMGGTALGQMTILGNTMEGIKETLGAGFVQPLSDIAHILVEELAKPEVREAVTALATAFGRMATTILPPLASLLPVIAAGMTLIMNAATLIANAIATGDWSPVVEALKIKAGEWGAAMWQGMTVSFPTALTTWANSPDTAAAIKAAGISIGGALAQAVVDGILPHYQPGGDAAVASVWGMITGIIGQGEAMLASIRGIGDQFAGDIIEGILLKIPGMDLNVAEAIAGGFRRAFTTVRQLLTGDVIGLVGDAYKQITDAWNAVEWLKLGTDLINGITKGVKDATQGLIDSVVGAARDAFNAAQNFLLGHSPSEKFATLGVSIVTGVIQGINTTTGQLSGASKDMVDAVFKSFWHDIKHALGGNPGSNIRTMLSDEMGNALSTVTVSASDTLGSAVMKAFKQMSVSMGGTVGAGLVAAGRILVQNLGSSALLPALGSVWGKLDALFGAAGTIGGLGSAAASRYETSVLDPMREQLRILEDQGTQLKAIAKLKADIADKERMLAGLAKQQADLQFLQAQADLIKMIRENGLDAKSILGGLKLGINADLPSLIQAMTAAMKQMVKAAQKELGVASPSRVFAEMGAQAMAGFGIGVLRAAPAAAGMAGQGMQRITNINLTAQYRYENEQSLFDRAKGLSLLYS